MKRATAQRICRIWGEIENANPNKSTEWLMQMTADIAKVEYENVVTAMYMESQESEAKDAKEGRVSTDVGKGYGTDSGNESLPSSKDDSIS